MANKKPAPLSQATRQQVAALFPPHHRAKASQLLVEFGNPSLGVRTAALHLSRGTLGGLRWAIALGNEDYRDLLQIAGHHYPTAVADPRVDGAGWVTSTDPLALLASLDPSPRKLRLLAVALANGVARSAKPERRWRAVRPVVEEYADKLAAGQRLDPASDKALGRFSWGHFLTEPGARPWWLRPGGPEGLERWAGHELATECTWRPSYEGSEPRIWVNVCRALYIILELAVRKACLPHIAAGARTDPAFIQRLKEKVRDKAERPARRELCRRVREVFANPFRTHAIDPAWLRWNGGIIRHLAQAIYDERRFDEVPVLGDALEDAGCADEGLLAHCRESAGHARGCWVVDLLLSKE